LSILCYHALDPDWPSPLAVMPEAFAAHCDWLARSRRVIPLAEAVARMSRSGRLPRGVVALTFDDGFESIHRHATPVLAAHWFPSTVFVVARTLSPDGLAVDWVDDPPTEPLRTLTLDQVLEMRDSGVEVGSHSSVHHDLTRLSEAECERDLRESRELLEDLLHGSVRHLAYPRGRSDERVGRAAGRAGFANAFTLPEAREPRGPFAIPRAGVYRGNGVREVAIKSSSWYLPLRTNPLFPLLRRAIGRGATTSGPPG
jgi:peptidoglycan/xylan/chitin deacetylase (PgdA/CDA1 family)